jgi:23S rRNA (pseudouridine1915-N3)-methyltransferase
MQLHIIAVGRLKDPAIRQACADYQNRIRNYFRLEVKEVKDGGGSDRVAERVRQTEREALGKSLPQSAHIVALTREGKQVSSREFARRLEHQRDSGRDVAFVLGGAHGLHGNIIDDAHERLSLSAMTLPHELARLVLLEQVYRACTIMRGEPYHKGADR